MKQKYISKFSDISLDDIDKVGGKNASLGEMINNLSALGINVPDGFATTSEAYKLFIESNNIDDKIQKILNELDLDSIKDLANAVNARLSGPPETATKKVFFLNVLSFFSKEK